MTQTPTTPTSSSAQPNKSERTFVRQTAQQVVQYLVLAHTREASVADQEAHVELVLREMVDEVAKMMMQAHSVDLADYKAQVMEQMLEAQADLAEARRLLILAREDITSLHAQNTRLLDMIPEIRREVSTGRADE